jgi:hypothetical protein
MENTSEKHSYTLQGWPVAEPPKDPNELVPLPGSNKVKAWCQAGKKVRVTFEVVKE